MANHFVVPDLCYLTAKWAKLLTKMGEITFQIRPFCFAISPGLVFHGISFVIEKIAK